MVNKIRAADTTQLSSVGFPTEGQWVVKKSAKAMFGGTYRPSAWKALPQAPPLEQETAGGVVTDRFRLRPAKEIYNLRDRTRSAFSQLSLGFAKASKSNFIGYRDDPYSECRYRTAERNNRYAT